MGVAWATSVWARRAHGGQGESATTPCRDRTAWRTTMAESATWTPRLMAVARVRRAPAVPKTRAAGAISATAAASSTNIASPAAFASGRVRVRPERVRPGRRSGRPGEPSPNRWPWPAQRRFVGASMCAAPIVRACFISAGTAAPSATAFLAQRTRTVVTTRVLCKRGARGSLRRYRRQREWVYYITIICVSRHPVFFSNV